MKRLLHAAIPLAVLLAPAARAGEHGPANLPAPNSLAGNPRPANAPLVNAPPGNAPPGNAPAVNTPVVNGPVNHAPALAGPAANGPAGNAVPVVPGAAVPSPVPGLPAGPGPVFHGPIVPGFGPFGFHGYDPAFGLPPTALIEVPFNNTNLYPYGGWTLYPGEPGSGVPSMSVYSHVNGVVPPAVSARMVLFKLHNMGIPIVAPEPQFLNKNPAIAEGVYLPVPNSWRKKEEPKEKGGPKKNGDDKTDSR